MLAPNLKVDTSTIRMTSGAAKQAAKATGEILSSLSKSLPKQNHHHHNNNNQNSNKSPMMPLHSLAAAGSVSAAAAESTSSASSPASTSRSLADEKASEERIPTRSRKSVGWDRIKVRFDIFLVT